MNDRKLKVMTTIAAVLTVGELGSAVMIWRENYPGSLPWAAVVFAVFFGIATWLLRSGRVTAGTVFAALLCLFEVVEYPSWARITSSAFAVVALAGLGTAIVVLAGRLRRNAAA
jgi:hypothetical protein